MSELTSAAASSASRLPGTRERARVASIGCAALALPLSSVRLSATSFSVADGVLCIGGAWAVARAYRQRRRGGDLRLPRALLVAAACCIVFSLLSGISGALLAPVSFSPRALFSATLQYAFVLGFLPVVAWACLRPRGLWTFLRLVSLGYLLAMIPTIALMHPRAPYELRAYFHFTGRATGPYGNANAFAAVLAIVAPLYASLSLVERGVWAWVGHAGLLSTLVCLALSASFGGALVFAVVSLAYILTAFVWSNHPLRKEKRRAAILGLALIILLPLSVAALAHSPWASAQIRPRLTLLRELTLTEWLGRDGGSWSNRLLYLREAVEQIAARGGGLWGHGLKQSEAVSAHGFSVHATPLLLWVEGGLPLLVAFCTYLILLGRNLRRLGLVEPRLAIPIGFALLAFLLSTLLQTHMYMRYYWLPLLPAMLDWSTDTTVGPRGEETISAAARR